MTISAADIETWRGAIGRSAERRQLLDVESARRFAVAIGADPDVERTPPPFEQWAWFLEAAPDSEIGADGHPKRGRFLPAVSLPRRMFASASVAFEAPLVLDRMAQLDLRIADVAHKSGSSGDLVFVKVDRTLTQDGRVRIRERQTLVYRESGDAVPLPEVSLQVEDGELWTPSPVNLFRFSAVTFNSHRIHYDAAYTREVEGYPALVVQGPFVASKLALLAAQDGEIAALEFRAQAPLFVDQPVRLLRVAPGVFHALRCDGAVATILKAEYR